MKNAFEALQITTNKQGEKLQAIAEMKSAVEALQIITNKQGEKLQAIAEMVQIVKTLKETSEKQSGRIENIEAQVHHAKGTLTAFKWIGAIIGVALTVLEIYKHFPR
jgi:P2-related tail formation protein